MIQGLALSCKIMLSWRLSFACSKVTRHPEGTHRRGVSIVISLAKGIHELWYRDPIVLYSYMERRRCPVFPICAKTMSDKSASEYLLLYLKGRSYFIRSIKLPSQLTHSTYQCPSGLDLLERDARTPEGEEHMRVANACPQ